MMTEVFEIVALPFGGVLLTRGLLYLSLLCVLIGLYSTEVPSLMQFVVASSILFTPAL